MHDDTDHTIYATRDEALYREIQAPVLAGDTDGLRFDWDALADQLLEYVEVRDAAGAVLVGRSGWRRRPELADDEVWAAVEAHAAPTEDSDDGHAR